jgi:transposase
MAIVAGFDVHRTQITFDALDTETGEVHRGRIAADPESVRGWVGRFEGQRVDVAVEACTGWLFVCEALREAGADAHEGVRLLCVRPRRLGLCVSRAVGLRSGS